MEIHKSKIIRAALFDLDGTLIKLPIDYNRVRQELSSTALNFGIKTDFRHILEEIERIKSILPADKGLKFSNSCFEIIERHEVDASKEAEAIVGAKELFINLKGKGIRIGVISRNSLKCIDASLEETGLKEYVDLIVGRESVSRTKPSPEPIFFALKTLNVEPGEAIFVGDHEYDRIASEKAGVPFVLFGRRDFNGEVKFRIERLVDLLSIIDGRFSH